MACRPGKRVAFQDVGDADEDDSGEPEDIQYKDFFDPAEAPAAALGLPQTSGSFAARCRADKPNKHQGFWPDYTWAWAQCSAVSSYYMHALCVLL